MPNATQKLLRFAAMLDAMLLAIFTFLLYIKLQTENLTGFEQNLTEYLCVLAIVGLVLVALLVLVPSVPTKSVGIQYLESVLRQAVVDTISISRMIGGCVADIVAEPHQAGWISHEALRTMPRSTCVDLKAQVWAEYDVSHPYLIVRLPAGQIIVAQFGESIIPAEATHDSLGAEYETVLWAGQVPLIPSTLL